MGLFGNDEPKNVRVRCTAKDDFGSQEIVCKIYEDDEEVSTLTIRGDDKNFDFEISNPKYLAAALEEIKKAGIL